MSYIGIIITYVFIQNFILADDDAVHRGGDDRFSYV